MTRNPDDSRLTPEEQEAARSLLGAFKDLSAADVQGALLDLREDSPPSLPAIGPTGAPMGGKSAGATTNRMPTPGGPPAKPGPTSGAHRAGSLPTGPTSGAHRAGSPPPPAAPKPAPGATAGPPLKGSPGSIPPQTSGEWSRVNPTASRPAASIEPAAQERRSEMSARLKGKATQYRYRAKDDSGQIQEGYVEANSLDRARQQLMQRFPALLEVAESSASHQRTQTIRVNHDHVVVFYRRLASMLAAGVTVTRSLEFLQRSEEDRKLAEVLDDVVEALHAGRSLSHIMGSGYLRHVFSPAAVGLVGMGEQTGNLVDAISKLADMTESQQRQRRAIVSAMTYPAVLLLVILIVTGLFIVILGPGDSGLFALFGGKLPWPTQVLVTVSKVLRSPWILLAALGVMVMLVLWVRRMLQVNASLRMKVHERILGLPIVGSLVQKTLSARMLYVMCCAIQVGVPMVKAMQMAREVCTNDAIARDFEGALRMFRNGDDLADALEKFQVFPRLVTSMIHMGVETANLDTILLRVSQTYEEEVEMSLNNAVRLAEPILLCFAGVLSAFMALATLLPVIEVVNKL